ncbi:glutathione S-transferase [Pseudomonas aeruginosa]|nr:glutathione S-transferase [Pseudomonas aeruginosa]
MQLIGMLDSPFVRRVAIALRLLDLPYEHRPLSVFRNFEAFSLFNPMVKAPSLVLDDGTVLMDSSLILDYLECLAGPERSLLPQRPEGPCTSAEPDRRGAGGLREIGADLLRTEPAPRGAPPRPLAGAGGRAVAGGLRLAGGGAAPGTAGARRRPRPGRGDRRGGPGASANWWSPSGSSPANTRSWRAIRIMRRGCRCSWRRRRSEPPGVKGGNWCRYMSWSTWSKRCCGCPRQSSCGAGSADDWLWAFSICGEASVAGPFFQENRNELFRGGRERSTTAVDHPEGACDLRFDQRDADQGSGGHPLAWPGWASPRRPTQLRPCPVRWTGAGPRRTIWAPTEAGERVVEQHAIAAEPAYADQAIVGQFGSRSPRRARPARGPVGRPARSVPGPGGRIRCQGAGRSSC